MVSFVTTCLRSSWFNETEPPMWAGAPFRLHYHMSGYRFDQINNALHFTLTLPPVFRDMLHSMRDLICAFNEYIHHMFIFNWVSCGDESILVWTNRWTCPRWIFCPRKPHS
eukprot:14169463-Ditylum_brightwellii.AAC.1